MQIISFGYNSRQLHKFIHEFITDRVLARYLPRKSSSLNSLPIVKIVHSEQNEIKFHQFLYPSMTCFIQCISNRLYPLRMLPDKAFKFFYKLFFKVCSFSEWIHSYIWKDFLSSKCSRRYWNGMLEIWPFH